MAYSGVTLLSFRFIAVSFQLVPLHSGIILVHFVSFRRRSGTFRFHSCPFPFIPASFRLVPVYSGSFRYIPFRSVPFLCLVTPIIMYIDKTRQESDRSRRQPEGSFFASFYRNLQYQPQLTAGGGRHSSPVACTTCPQ